MSLINQALRKAQRDRNPSRMAAQHDGSLPPPPAGYAAAPAAGGPSPALLIVLILGVVVLLGLVAGLTVVLLQDKAAPAEMAETAPAAASAAAAPEVSAAPAVAPLEVVREHAAAPAVATGTESDVLADLRAAREAAEAKLAEEARAAAEAEAAARAAAEAAAEKAAAPPNEAVIQWLSEARVTGVRLSPSGNKVIINNAAYEAGETVHFGLGLKVLVIQENRILFVDANDKKYMKRL